MRRKKMVELNPKRAIGYLRVSTEEQALGPEAQRAAIDAWCKREGVELVSVFVDQGICGAVGLDDSGALLNLDKRPGLMSAIEAMEPNGAGILIAAKRDRFARDTMLMALIERLAERKGAKVRTADGMGDGDGPEAQLMRGLIDLFAQYERAIIRSRTKAALAVKKSRRERVGAIPYGWRLVDGGRLVPEMNEQTAASVAQALRKQGVTFSAIGQALTIQGYYTRNGNKWHPEQVKRLMSVEVIGNE